MPRVSLFLFAAICSAADPALTIYNQNFAVVRETVPLALQSGETKVRFSGATSYLEPESVILRDPSGRIALRILEQNYRADAVSADALLALYEGQTIEFAVQNQGRTDIISGRIIRAGRTQPPQEQPLIEVDGRLRFQLPGLPMFPKLAGDTVLKPMLDWTLYSPAAAKLDAEFSYVTGGMSWDADYNIVAPAAGEALDVIGWVTMRNQSGKAFENVRIKLMAGDVSKLQPRQFAMGGLTGGVIGGIGGGAPGPPPVTEKTFDEYHLYTLPRATTLHDRETKQVEFLRAAGVKSTVVYIYDGVKIDTARYGAWVHPEQLRNDASYGALSNPKVWVMREFANTESNLLGMPLPKGRVRFYRRDTDGRMEFTGEDTIRHTPKGETVRVFTGAAFDLTGERKRTNYRIDHGRSTLEESFEIKVRNRKGETVDVKIVEHLYRWSTWDIHTRSEAFTKTESQTVEFPVKIDPGQEKTVTYSVRYTW